MDAVNLKEGNQGSIDECEVPEEVLGLLVALLEALGEARVLGDRGPALLHLLDCLLELLFFARLLEPERR